MSRDRAWWGGRIRARVVSIWNLPNRVGEVVDTEVGYLRDTIMDEISDLRGDMEKMVTESDLDQALEQALRDYPSDEDFTKLVDQVEDLEKQADTLESDRDDMRGELDRAGRDIETLQLLVKELHGRIERLSAAMDQAYGHSGWRQG